MTTLAKTPGAEVVATPVRGPTTPPPRILVVEDDALIRQMNAKVLQRSGYQVVAAEDGAAGWEALYGNDFDLLITDHAMPRLTGLELVKKVRSARLPLPVILATGTWPDEELARHPRLQLAATLLKPFSPQQLLETVAAVLGGADRCAGVAPEHCPPMPTAPLRQPSSYHHLRNHDQGETTG
jgi:CheY-like chemotaxis protein